VPPGAVVVQPVTLLPLAVVRRAVRCHRRRRAARRRCRAACRPAAPCPCRPSPSSCRPSPFVFLGGQSEEFDLTKAQWRRP
jgi:hypothetical protein